MRRYGDVVKPGQNYKLRQGVYAILPRDGQLLLTLQVDMDGLFEPELQLPGGGIDRGESPVAALHREVFEETGWRIGAPRRIGAYRRFTFMPEYDLWAEKVCTLYLARPVRALGPPSESGHMAIWTNAVDAAALLASPGDAAFVQSLA